MIKITKLNKYYNRKKSNELHVINDVSISFPSSGLVTILGESGCGKTSILNVLGGMDNFESGTITIDDEEIKRYNRKQIDRIRNEKIGYIFQNYLLLPLNTVYENLKLMLNMYKISDEEKEKRIDYVLNAVGMLKYKKRKVIELSGGQQQRVAIARALIKSPSVILADEPTGNLDEKNTIQIMNIIKKISETRLVILVSHERSIAQSYSDYIIEVKDGQIEKQYETKNSTTYQYKDDQNIYLKELKYQKIEDDNVSIDFYSNEKDKINLKIVCQNGKFYIKTENDIILLDKSSEVELIDDYKKEIDTNVEIEETSFELKPLKFHKTPSLSLKQRINLAFHNLENAKKRTKILFFPLFIVVILILVSIQGVVSSSYVDRKNLTSYDSRVATISVEKANAMVDRTLHIEAFKYLCNDVLENYKEASFVFDFVPSFSFTQPSFTQVKDQLFYIDKFQPLTTSLLNSESLIYGRMPEKMDEVVFEKWVLERTIEDKTIKNVMSVQSFINKKIKLKGLSHTFTIVGVADNNENSAYFDKWGLLNIVPSSLLNSTYTLAPESYYIQETGNEPFNLSKDEYVGNTAKQMDSYPSLLRLNSDFDLGVNLKTTVSNEDFNYKIIVSDQIYTDLVISLLTVNYDELNIVAQTQEEKDAIKDFVKKRKSFYKDGSLEVTEENGFNMSVAHTLDRVYLEIKALSKYDDELRPYIQSAKKEVTSRLLVTFAIVVISLLIVFFAIKSFAIKNIYDIGVYRAIGINKRSIVFVYALEVLIISLKTTLVGGIAYYLVTSFVSSIPIIDASIDLEFSIFAISISSLIALNVLVGIIPVLLYLKNTPSQILSKHDI